MKNIIRVIVTTVWLAGMVALGTAFVLDWNLAIDHALNRDGGSQTQYHES